MTNPFENADAPYLVLVNDREEHSLWPADLAVPDGWAVRLGPAARQECLDHIETSWTALDPASSRS